MDKNTKIEKFNIECKDCQINKRVQNSMLYVNWEKRYYMLSCLNCNTMEAFDEFGKRVESKQDEKKLQVN